MNFAVAGWILSLSMQLDRTKVRFHFLRATCVPVAYVPNVMRLAVITSVSLDNIRDKGGTFRLPKEPYLTTGYCHTVLEGPYSDITLGLAWWWQYDTIMWPLCDIGSLYHGGISVPYHENVVPYLK